MARTSIWQKAFNREADFIILKNFDVDGVAQLPGKPFDKHLVTIRTHRQLFDQRYIGETSSAVGKPPGPVTPKPAQPPALAPVNVSSSDLTVSGAAKDEPVTTSITKDATEGDAAGIEAISPNRGKRNARRRKAKASPYQIKKAHGSKWAVWKGAKKVSRAMAHVDCLEFIRANTRTAE